MEDSTAQNHPCALQPEGEMPPAITQAQPCGGRDYCSRFPFCGCGSEPLFPERDPSKPAEQQGLFRKFDIRRVDGSDQPGGKHCGCKYYVLDLTHDKHAPAAMRAYAASCKETHPQLAADIEAEFGSQTADVRDAERYRFEQQKDYALYVQRCPDHGIKPLPFDEYKLKSDAITDEAIAGARMRDASAKGDEANS
jgi:hypothetical protein